MNKNIMILAGFAAYLFFWGLAVIVKGLGGNMIFCTFFLVIACVLVPLLFTGKFKIALRKPQKKVLFYIGIIYLIFFSISGILAEDIFNQIAKNNPDFEAIIKYLILFIPMSFGVTMYCFYLIPEIAEGLFGNKILKIILPVVTSGLSCGLSFFVDKLGSVEMFIVMGIMGMFYGIGYLLVKSFYVMWFFFFISMMVHTLAEGKYYNYSWFVLTFELVLFAAAASSWYFYKRILYRPLKNQND
ncbi:MAG: hypothetical protein JW982_02315 [Spirochaetes bacterium]|nr:hypothetical protein [Spirochaetota bacterium]